MARLKASRGLTVTDPAEPDVALNPDITMMVAISEDGQLIGWFMRPELEAEAWRAVWYEADSEVADMLRACRINAGLSG